MRATVTVPEAATAAPAISYSELNAIVQVTAIGLNTFRQVMEESLTTLTNTVKATSSQIASMSTSLAETKATADKAFRQASAANIALTGQGARLDALADAISTFDSDLRTIRAPTEPHPDLPTLIQAALDPLKTSLSMAVDETVALATATAEAAIRSSFDQSAAALNDRVTVSLEAFDKRIDTLHGSTYGHLKKTTLPDFARRLDALEARGVRHQPPATSKPDPDGNEDIRIVGDAPRTTIRVTMLKALPPLLVTVLVVPPRLLVTMITTTLRQLMTILRGRPTASMSTPLLAVGKHGPCRARTPVLTLRTTSLRVPLMRRTALQLASAVVPPAPPSSVHTIHQGRRRAIALPSNRPPSTRLCIIIGPPMTRPIPPTWRWTPHNANGSRADLSSHPATVIVRCTLVP